MFRLIFLIKGLRALWINGASKYQLVLLLYSIFSEIYSVHIDDRKSQGGRLIIAIKKIIVDTYMPDVSVNNEVIYLL